MQPAAPEPASPAASETEAPKFGGIFLVANRKDPPGAFDTLKTNSYNLHTISGGLNGNGNLVRPCRGDVYKVCGGVAQSWESNADFTQWTFKIRDGIKWHDGKPFTAEDAKFWVELANFGYEGGGKKRGPAFFRAEWGELLNVETLGDNRLRITLKEPAPQFLTMISLPQRNIAHPPHLLKPLFDAGKVNTAPVEVGNVSIGPFKFDSREKGAVVRIRRNELYWEKDDQGRQLPYLDGVDFLIISSPSAMDAAFRVGRLDGGARGFGYELTKERKDSYVKDLGDAVWFLETIGGRLGLSMNTLKPGPIQDVRVRKAIALWSDKRAMIDAISGGLGYIYPIFAPSNPFSSPDFLTWPGWNEATRSQDRAEAKRLMAEAGYADGFDMSLIVPNRWSNRGEFWTGQLSGLGINLKLNIVDEAGWSAGRLGLDSDAQLGSVSQTIPEAAEVQMTSFSRSKFAPSKHEDEKVLAFFDKLRLARSLDERIQIWRELEEYWLVDQVYNVPGGGSISTVPYQSYVKGMVIPAEGIMNDTEFTTVWLDK